MESGERPNASEFLEEGVSDAISSESLYGDAESYCRVEVGLVDLLLKGFEIIKFGNGYDFNIVRIGKDMIVAQVPINVDSEAVGDCSFYVYDSIDKEEIYIGSTEVGLEQNFDAYALVTLEGEFKIHPEDVEITDVEVVDMIDSVDFGWVEIDHEPDYDDE